MRILHKSIEDEWKSVQKDAKSIEIRRRRLSNSLQMIRRLKSFWICSRKSAFHMRIPHNSIENAWTSVKTDSKSIEIRRGRLSNSLRMVWAPIETCWSWCWCCLAEGASVKVAFQLDFPKMPFSHSHSLWRRVFQIGFSESAPLRFSFLKARLSDSPFWRRASQIMLSQDTPFRIEILRKRLTGSKMLRNQLRNHFRNRFRNRCSYRLDSVPLHSGQPAPIMEWAGQP